MLQIEKRLTAICWRKMRHICLSMF